MQANGNLERFKLQSYPTWYVVVVIQDLNWSLYPTAPSSSPTSPSCSPTFPPPVTRHPLICPATHSRSPIHLFAQPPTLSVTPSRPSCGVPQAPSACLPPVAHFWPSLAYLPAPRRLHVTPCHSHYTTHMPPCSPCPALAPCSTGPVPVALRLRVLWPPLPCTQGCGSMTF